MKKLLFILITLLLSSTSAQSQNVVVDEIKNNTKSVVIKNATLSLDPNMPIKYNYEQINSVIPLLVKSTSIDYTIFVEGHYTNSIGEFYNICIGVVHIKGKYNDCTERTMIKGMNNDIINALTELYAHSLDNPFDVSSKEYHKYGVNYEYVQVPTGREFINNENNEIFKEYVTERINTNTMYHLYSNSKLYKKIRRKVIEETCLKGTGMYGDNDDIYFRKY